MSVDISSATATAGVDPSRLRVAGAIKQAADTSGTSFEYLLATAKMESNFNPKAAATTSSARGLFQFIDQTWLGTVKEAGSQLGYGKYADAISKSSSGNYYVNDPSMRTSIMKLRDDPDAASSMAAVLTQSNSFKLTGKIGRRPTDSELYMAHFMGVGGAAKLISNAEDNPNASAARLFPNAAAANRSIFFSSRRRHTRCGRDWSSDVCSSDLWRNSPIGPPAGRRSIGRSSACQRAAQSGSCARAQALRTAKRTCPGAAGPRSSPRASRPSRRTERKSAGQAKSGDLGGRRNLIK